MDIKARIPNLIEKTKNSTPEEIIRVSYEEFGDRLKLASSLGEEDQILTHMISKVAPEVNVFTLDTGRLFPESYDLMQKTQKRYPMDFEVFYPDTKSVEKMVKDKGINLFYESVDNRKLCCGIRKVEPLKRALGSVDAWICGLRRAQSITRATLKPFEWDEANQKIKISPLAAWTLSEVREYIDQERVDVNPLHSQGFVSIGCSCCTRAVQAGEDIRSGRWWWEQPEQKECGLHNRINFQI